MVRYLRSREVSPKLARIRERRYGYVRRALRSVTDAMEPSRIAPPAVSGPTCDR